MTKVVHIFDVTHRNGQGQTMWLCLEECAPKRRGKQVSLGPGGIDGPCDDCITLEQAAPGYRTPTPTVAPTSPDAFAPAPGWKPDAPMKPWPHAAAARRRQQQTATEEAA